MDILDQGKFDQLKAVEFVGDVTLVYFADLVRVRSVKKKYVDQMQELFIGHKKLRNGFKIVGKTREHTIIALQSGLYTIGNNDMHQYFCDVESEAHIQEHKIAPATDEFKPNLTRYSDFATARMEEIPQIFKD
jgi:hypothetical protein